MILAYDKNVTLKQMHNMQKTRNNKHKKKEKKKMKKTSKSNLLQKMQEKNLCQRQGLDSKEKRNNLNRISCHYRGLANTSRNNHNICVR